MNASMRVARRNLFRLNAWPSWFGPAGVLGVAVVLALLTSVSSIGTGLMLDDRWQAAFILRHLKHGGADWWNLFDTCCHEGTLSVAQRIDAGQLPWWTHPQLSIAFLRPLAAATQYADYLLWPHTPWLMHLHNMAWYALLVGFVGVLYRRMISSHGAAALATFLYAIDDAHGEGTAWIASRNTVMTACFVAMALVAYDRARADAWRPGRWLSSLCLLLGFASSEAAIAAWAYLVPYAVLLDRARPRSRMLALAPLLAVSLAWQALYRVLGYGVHGSGEYRDPLDVPWFFLTHRLPEALPLVLREQLMLPKAAFAHFAWLLHPAVVVVSVVLAALAGLLWLRMLVRDREVAYWSCALIGSALPVCAIGMWPRLLYLPGIAAFALVALVARELWNITLTAVAESGVPWRKLQLTLAATVLGGLLMVHAVLPLVLAPHGQDAVVDYEERCKRSAGLLPAYDPARVDTLLVLNAPNFAVTLLSPHYADKRPWPARVYVLGATAAPFHVARPDADTLLLQPRDGYLLEPVSQSVRAPETPFARGQVIRVGSLTARIERLTADGRPATVSLRAAHLDDSKNLWVAWYQGRYQRVRLPKVGTTYEIPGF